jgi:hypothetical protein
MGGAPSADLGFVDGIERIVVARLLFDLGEAVFDWVAPAGVE